MTRVQGGRNVAHLCAAFWPKLIRVSLDWKAKKSGKKQVVIYALCPFCGEDYELDTSPGSIDIPKGRG